MQLSLFKVPFVIFLQIEISNIDHVLAIINTPNTNVTQYYETKVKHKLQKNTFF